MTSLCDVTSDFSFVDLWLEEYVVLISTGTASIPKLMITYQTKYYVFSFVCSMSSDRLISVFRYDASTSH